jgi:acetyl esterase/lipase
MQRDYFYGLKWLAMSLVRHLVSIFFRFLSPSDPHAREPSIKTSYIPTTDPRRRPLPLHIYLPSSDSTENHNSETPLPIHINIHGSGFCLSNFGADAAFCAYLADSIPCIVVDADHRKAPEHPWPAGPDDIRDVVRYVRTKLALEHQTSCKWDTSRISIGGFSSGGCLALIEASRIRDSSEEDQPLTAVVSFYPS